MRRMPLFMGLLSTADHGELIAGVFRRVVLAIARLGLPCYFSVKIRTSNTRASRHDQSL